MRGTDGHEAYYVSCSAMLPQGRTILHAGRILPVDKDEDFAEDYTYEMAESHLSVSADGRGCPKCIRWLSA
eukprot:7009640-Prymnesium_polylepis.1